MLTPLFPTTARIILSYSSPLSVPRPTGILPESSPNIGLTEALPEQPREYITNIRPNQFVPCNPTDKKFIYRSLSLGLTDVGSCPLFLIDTVVQTTLHATIFLSSPTDLVFLKVRLQDT